MELNPSDIPDPQIGATGWCMSSWLQALGQPFSFLVGNSVPSDDVSMYRCDGG
jgi:hypothetical protein